MNKLSSKLKLCWTPLKLSHADELQLDTTFRCGQSFRWKYRNMESPESSYWTGVIDNHVFALKQTPDDVHFSLLTPVSLDENQTRDILREYFYLDVPLVSLFGDWSSDNNFKMRKDRFKGLRLLRQDPVECTFSFICSQNNNIARITKMVDSMCLKYGEKILEHDGEEYYSFPTIERIAEVEEDELRDLGFGYRAKYIPKAASQMMEKGGIKWLEKLRSLPKKEVQEELVTLTGVGPKVADCISLFSLDKLDVIPVDTHVWQIAQTYMPKLRGKKLTQPFYEEIGDFFKGKFGDKCGWAHTILFAAELTTFKEKDVSIKSETIIEENVDGVDKKIQVKKEITIKTESIISTSNIITTTRKRTSMHTIKTESIIDDDIPPLTKRRRKST